MKPTKQLETKINIIVSSTTQPQPAKKTKIDRHLLKATSLIIITIISWLNPEATIAILLSKLFFIFLDWFNQQENA